MDIWTFWGECWGHSEVRDPPCGSIPHLPNTKEALAYSWGSPFLRSIPATGTVTLAGEPAKVTVPVAGHRYLNDWAILMISSLDRAPLME